MYVAFGGTGDRVVTFVAGQIIRVWDARSGQMINMIETGLPEKRNRFGDIHNSVVLSDNGDFAFALNRDNFASASLWSLADGALIRRYSLPQSDSFNVALTDDGKSVYVVDKDDLYRWPGRAKDAL
jgi:WD40 repeat protein